MKALLKKNIVVLVCLCMTISYSQDTSLNVSIGMLKTELENTAISYGLKYLEDLGERFQNSTSENNGKNHLFFASPDLNIESGNEDTFSSINLKAKGTWVFFKQTTIRRNPIPVIDYSKLVHFVNTSIGIETNNEFTVLNTILEIGYEPYYHSRHTKVSPLLKAIKIGVFAQGGYKFDFLDSNESLAGGDLDESMEGLDSSILRFKGVIQFDTKRILELNQVGIGIKGSATGWYDILESEIYHRIESSFSLYFTDKNIQSLDFKYENGSGAPNFNQGDQFGIGLTVAF